jgi:hypothetical protein
MLIISILAALFIVYTSAAPRLLHDEPHHSHEVLDNIHDTVPVQMMSTLGNLPWDVLERKGRNMGHVWVSQMLFNLYLINALPLGVMPKARKTICSSSPILTNNVSPGK